MKSQVKQAFLTMAADEDGLAIMSAWGHIGYAEYAEYAITYLVDNSSEFPLQELWWNGITVDL